MAGSTLLPAGNYTVKLDGANAVLLNVDKDQTYTAPVKVESEAKKFDQTAVMTGTSGGGSCWARPGQRKIPSARTVRVRVLTL